MLQMWFYCLMVCVFLVVEKKETKLTLGFYHRNHPAVNYLLILQSNFEWVVDLQLVDHFFLYSFIDSVAVKWNKRQHNFVHTQNNFVQTQNNHNEIHWFCLKSTASSASTAARFWWQRTNAGQLSWSSASKCSTSLISNRYRVRWYNTFF